MIDYYEGVTYSEFALALWMCVICSGVALATGSPKNGKNKVYLQNTDS